MDTEKITKSQFSYDGSTAIKKLFTTDGSSTSIIVNGLNSTTDTHFILEAFNVANETGKSPRELVELLKEIAQRADSLPHSQMFTGDLLERIKRISNSK